MDKINKYRLFDKVLVIEYSTTEDKNAAAVTDHSGKAIDLGKRMNVHCDGYKEKELIGDAAAIFTVLAENCGSDKTIFAKDIILDPQFRQPRKTYELIRAFMNDLFGERYEELFGEDGGKLLKFGTGSAGLKFTPQPEDWEFLEHIEKGPWISDTNRVEDNRDILDRLCGSIPASEFFDAVQKPVSLEEFFVEPRLLHKGKPANLQNIVNDIGIRSSNLIFLTGESGSGRTLAMNAIVMGCVEHARGGSVSWTKLESPLSKEWLVFDMDLSRMRGIFDNRSFMEYIAASLRYSDTGSSEIELSPKAKGFYEYFRKLLENPGERRILLMIHNLEKMSSEYGEAFFKLLTEFLDAHKHVTAVCSTTDSMINDWELQHYPKYSMDKPGLPELTEYIKKWISMVTRPDELKADDIRDDKIMAGPQYQYVVNDPTIKSIVLESPRMIMLYLAATKIDHSHRLNSQTHMLKIISSTAENYAIDHADKARGSIDRYAFITPLGMLCLKCAENDSMEFDDDMITAVFEQHSAGLLSTYQSDFTMDPQSAECIFVSVLSQFPFIREKVNKRNKKKYEITLPIWRNYYAALAVSKGLVCGSGQSYIYRLKSYINGTMQELRDGSDNGRANMWISILAMAAKLSRENAEYFIEVLLPYVGDISPRHRRGMEVAIEVLLKFLSNRCLISEERRKKIVRLSLSCYLYHNEIDDLVTLVSSSVYRESITEMIFREFAASVSGDGERPVPCFHFTIGFLAVEYIDLSEWNGSVDSAIRMVTKKAESGETYFANNADNIKKIFDRLGRKYKSSAEEDKIESMILALALNSYTWLLVKDDVMLSQLHQIDESCRIDERKWDSLEKMCPILLSCLKERECCFQIHNAVAYALANITAYERSSGREPMQVNKMSNTDTYAAIFDADRRSREIFRDRVKVDPQTADMDSQTQPYYGALRLMENLEPRFGDVAVKVRCVEDGEYPENDGYDVYYRGIWEDYKKIYEETRDKAAVQNGSEADFKAKMKCDNAKRYLMLMFKMCVAAGSFDETECVEAIKLIWSLKYKGVDIDKCNELPTGEFELLGIEYDREDELFRYMLNVYRQLSGKTE